jgi:uncharacterized membrane protein YhaH (DUF805 family)
MTDIETSRAHITAMTATFLHTVASSPVAPHEPGRDFANLNQEFTEQVAHIGTLCEALYKRDGSIVWNFAIPALGQSGRFTIYEREGTWTIEVQGRLVADSNQPGSALNDAQLHAVASDIQIYLQNYTQEWLMEQAPMAPVAPQPVTPPPAGNRQQVAAMAKTPIFTLLVSIGALLLSWFTGLLSPLFVAPAIVLVLRKWHQTGWSKPSGMLLASLAITGLATLGMIVEVISTLMEMAAYLNAPTY